MNNPLQQSPPPMQLQQILDELVQLRDDIIVQAEARLDEMTYTWPAQEQQDSATNLCTYLAFRRHDVRDLQDKLAAAGLSSLGRGESHILDNITRVIDILSQATVTHTEDHPEQIQLSFFDGRKILEERTNSLFGKAQGDYYTRIMTTLPAEAATSDNLIRELIASGIDCARINCAHDQALAWEKMISYIRQASSETGNECKVFMDLAGMKIRTGPLASGHHRESKIRLFEGDIFELHPDAHVSVPESQDPMNKKKKPAIISCSNDEVLDFIKVGDSVWIDDGKLGSVIEDIAGRIIRLRVTHSGPKGVRIRADKGLNFPDTRLNLPMLTDKDYQNLDFVCAHADILGVSFVQSAADLDHVISELVKRSSTMPIVAKIETREAIKNLSDILFKGLSYPGQFAVMIARGDLAVELGSVRMAEIQEEILWLCEAAHVPAIWATQVLETLAKKGIVSRPEITDAAMSVRAECVMLNKGDYIKSAVVILRDILSHMQAHQYKKVSRLRALHW